MTNEPHSTLGALFIGVALSDVFYGLTCYQAYLYFSQWFKIERRIINISAIVVVFLETLTTALWNYEVYWLLVCAEEEMTTMTPVQWVPMLSAGVNGLVGTIVQLFFAWRVYIMSERNRWLFGAACVLSFAQLVFAIGLMISGLIPDPEANLLVTKVWATSSFALTAGADMYITACMCYFLHTRKSGFASMDSVVNSLIINTISNGLLSSVIALLALILNVILPESMAYITMCALLGKAYSNAILASLNARQRASSRLPIREAVARRGASRNPRLPYADPKATSQASITAYSMEPRSFTRKLDTYDAEGRNTVIVISRDAEAELA